MCNDVLKTNFAYIRKWSYPSVNDTEKYDRNTEPGIPLKYGDIRSRWPYLAVYGRKRAWAFDLGMCEGQRMVSARSRDRTKCTSMSRRFKTSSIQNEVRKFFRAEFFLTNRAFEFSTEIHLTFVFRIAHPRTIGSDNCSGLYNW